MRLTDLFIKRPVLAIVVNLIILIAGLQSIRSLSVRQFPRSDMANVVVTTAYTLLCFIHPGEMGEGHIKRRILDDGCE